MDENQWRATTSVSRRYLNKVCIMFKITAFFIITLLARLYGRIGILLICGNNLHNRIISPRGEAWAHTTRLTLTLFIEVPVSSQYSKRSCICVFGVSNLSLSAVLIFHFGIVPRVWYCLFFILELFREWGITCFSF